MMKREKISPCTFCQIAAGKIPAQFEYEDDELMVFPDIDPQAPIHLLIVAKKHEPELADDPGSVLVKMLKLAQDLIKKHRLDQKGYRVVANGGGATLVKNHLHLHLLGRVTSDRRV